MKRITLLAVVALLALSVSGVVAFADDMAPALAFSGSLYSGLQFNGSSTAVTAKLYDQTNGDAEDFWLDGALAGKMAGLKFEIYTTDGATVVTDVLNGWWKPIDMLTISGGIGVGDLYTTPIEGWDSSSGSGWQVAIVPITGLQLGVWYAATTTAATADIMQLSGTLSYDMANIAKVGVGYAGGLQYLWAGFSLEAVAGLKTNVDFEYYGATSLYRGELDAGYTISGISANVWAFDSTKVGDAAWGVKPYVSYAAGMFTPGAYFEYNADASYSMGVNCSVAVEKQTIYFYFDYQSAQTWDGGINFKMAF